MTELSFQTTVWSHRPKASLDLEQQMTCFRLNHLSPVRWICVFEHSVMTNFNCACPAIQRGQVSGFLSEVPLDSLLVWASSEGSGETARMRRLAWTFAARIGDKYQIRLTRSIYAYSYSVRDSQNVESNACLAFLFLKTCTIHYYYSFACFVMLKSRNGSHFKHYLAWSSLVIHIRMKTSKQSAIYNTGEWFK